MKKKSPNYWLTVGLLIALMFVPTQFTQAQWTVFDPAQYELQVQKKLDEALRWVQTVNHYTEQLTRLKGILDLTEDLVAKQRNAIRTMSNIGRTVRGSIQLKDQVQALVTTRLRAIKAIDDRLRAGIFDPEQDMRDLDEYLNESIGRTSQDTLANRERLARMDNELERMQLELKKAHGGLAEAQSDRTKAKEDLAIEDAKPESERCASCVASLIEKASNCDLLIAHYTKEIARLDTEIKIRVQKYNIEMEERIKFGQQVQSMNQAWTDFNNTLDEIQRQLNQINGVYDPLNP
jgi:chromosome segregation ATPase